jgi:hypothetical protein
MPRTITMEVIIAAIRIITTLGIATVVIVTAAIIIRVTRPIGIQGSKDH